MKHSIVLLSLYTCVLLALGCNTSDNRNSNISEKPDEDKIDTSIPACDSIACNEMFVTVMLHIKNSSGAAVLLDDSYTVSVAGEDTIRDDSGVYPKGRYVVVNDNFRKQLRFNPTKYIFYGIKNGSVIVKEPFVITADCCHIKKQSGKDEVVIN